MPVFSLCLKTIRKNLPLLAIYFGVFALISVIMMSVVAREQAGVFAEQKTNIVFVTTEDTPLVAGLREELGKIANLVRVADDTESLQEALFFRRVSYILRIPPGFTEAFIAGQEAKLESTAAPEAAQAKLRIEMQIDRYLNMARLYSATLPELDLAQVTALVKGDLALATPVVFAGVAQDTPQVRLMPLYFNFLAYALTFAVILGVSSVLLTFSHPDLKRRNSCAPISLARFFGEIYLAITLFTVASWGFLVLLSLGFGYPEALEPSTPYLVLNSLSFALSVSGLALLIGNTIKSGAAVNAVANVVTLGSSFLSGVFVPRFLLDERLLRVASYFPTYWYVLANERLGEMTVFNWDSLSEVVGYMLIQLGFAAAFAIAALVAGKYKQRQA